MSKPYGEIHLPTPHEKQAAFIDSKAKRKIIRAGRRSGKTEGVAIADVLSFCAGKRVLYATPTADQIDRYWTVITRALAEPIEAGVLYKNKALHLIEEPGTERRIRAKTAWNADSLRGDYADELTLDEFQLMSEDTWNTVGAPMLADNDGNAKFIYTPPSLHSRSTTKATDPQHAAKMYKRVLQDESGRWEAFHFTSFDNPHISHDALKDLVGDMTALAYRMEIMAEDVDEAPGALWTRKIIEDNRWFKKIGDMPRVVVGVDPSVTATGDEAGIITMGCRANELYLLADDSLQGSPKTWAKMAVMAYHRHNADAIIAEKNNGGEMVEDTLKQVDDSVNVKLVHASRGKATRAEPISAVYEDGRGHHVGAFPLLEDELCLWIPGDASPNRLDALVWAGTYLLNVGIIQTVDNPFYD